MGAKIGFVSIVTLAECAIKQNKQKEILKILDCLDIITHLFQCDCTRRFRLTLRCTIIFLSIILTIPNIFQFFTVCLTICVRTVVKLS